MIKLMLKPFLKRYLGLFVSMAFISSLSIALLSSFASTIYNVSKACTSYLKDYQDADAVIKTNFMTREELYSFPNKIEEVEKIDARLTMDVYLKKSDDRIITSRIFTFNEDENTIFKRYILSSVDRHSDKINISVVRKFAENNDFKIGDTIKLGYYDLFIDFYINEIIETPEGMQARANEYVWTDNTDFGYLYIDEKELDKALYQISVKIEEKYANDPKYKKYYDALKLVVGDDLPDFVDSKIVGKNYASKFANQVLVCGMKGVTEEEVLTATEDFLVEKGVKVKSGNTLHSLFYVLYIENAIRQLKVAATFLPIFFYVVTMIVISLFINQIIQSMTPQIGIMMSIGVDKREIISLFLVYTLLMSIVSGILGFAVGYPMNHALAKVLIKVYSIPTISKAVNPLITASSFLSLIVLVVLTTAISCLRIYKITPKDATINNESKRKPIPKSIDHMIEKAPMNLKLGINSILQNPRRFIVSTFSIFAAFVIIILALFFDVSKKELIGQTVERRMNYDCQVYATEIISTEKINTLKTNENVASLEDCYYTYLEASTKYGETYLECLAFNHKSTLGMINIPSKTGKGSVKISEKGIVLNYADAEKLNVKVGDTISINKVKVKVTSISKQYFHPITYLSKVQMEEFGVDYVSSLLVNVNDDVGFLNALNDEGIRSMSVFTSNLSKDIHLTFDSINVFIYIMIGFSFGMGFLILTIMSQNSLMDQQRQLSVFRAIGFRIVDISNLWTLQSTLQLLSSTLFALPIGYLTAYILFKQCSNPVQAYPIIFSVPSVLLAFAFIFVIVTISHYGSMIKIKRWNISENTRCRE